MTEIFISYARHDTAIADRVSEALAKADIPFQRDVLALKPGDDFIDWMSRSIEQATYLILLVSNASMASDFVGQEWRSALASGTLVIPVRLDDTPVPALLRSVVYVDMRDGSGLEELVKVFVDEGTEIPIATMGASSSSEVISSKLTPRRLRRAMLHCFDETDFKSVLFEFDMSPNDIGGDSLSSQLISVLEILKRDDELDELIRHIATEDRLERCMVKYLEKSPD